MSREAELVSEFRDVIIQATSTNEAGDGRRLDLGFVSFTSSEIFQIPDYQQLYIPDTTVSRYAGSLTIEAPPSLSDILLRNWLIETPYDRRFACRGVISEANVLAEVVKFARAPHLNAESFRMLGLLSSSEEIKLAKDYDEAAREFAQAQRDAAFHEQLDEEEATLITSQRILRGLGRPPQVRYH